MKKITRLSVLLPVVLICMVIFAGNQVNAQGVTKKAQRTGPKLTDAYINEVNLVGEGIGLGYAIGYWAPSLALDFRCTIPFHPKMGMQIRVFMNQGHMDKERVDPAIGLALEYYGRTPIIAGIIRLYFGGGFYVAVRPRVWSDDLERSEEHLRYGMTPFFDKKYKRIGFAGGGKIGVEFFVQKNKSYFIEVGGQGPAHALAVDMGAHVLAGAKWYFGK